MSAVLRYTSPAAAIFNNLRSSRNADRNETAETPQSRFTPRVTIDEEKKAYFLRVDLPGLDKKDTKIRVEKNVLTLSGERRADNSHDCTYSERRFGTFERAFRLPDEVVQAQISAAMDKGVLTVTLPKAEETLPRKIDISVE
ncbi:MAG: Hsp20/alpha crystallin family protein [Fibrobacterota bacterium]